VAKNSAADLAIYSIE